MFKLIAICVIIILVLLVIGLFIYIIHSQHQDYITLRTRWEKDFKEYFKEYYEKIAKLKEEYNLSKHPALINFVNIDSLTPNLCVLFTKSKKSLNSPFIILSSTILLANKSLTPLIKDRGNNNPFSLILNFLSDSLISGEKILRPLVLISLI